MGAILYYGIFLCGDEFRVEGMMKRCFGRVVRIRLCMGIIAVERGINLYWEIRLNKSWPLVVLQRSERG